MATVIRQLQVDLEGPSIEDCVLDFEDFINVVPGSVTVDGRDYQADSVELSRQTISSIVRDRTQRDWIESDFQLVEFGDQRQFTAELLSIHPVREGLLCKYLVG